ncbi:hypothetical protein, partial [Paenibacillus dendritiformis]|uniref:hypothetical protein n=1 Tax=Paenibacillus dendritiformis TaxID=130049 RepID=UPI001C274850
MLVGLRLFRSGLGRAAGRANAILQICSIFLHFIACGLTLMQKYIILLLIAGIWAEMEQIDALLQDS